MGMANSDIADRAVLVFGAGGALGAGIARAFADAGAMVTGADKVAPPASRRIEDVKYEAVDVLDDREIGALIGQKTVLPSLRREVRVDLARRCADGKLAP